MEEKLAYHDLLHALKTVVQHLLALLEASNIAALRLVEIQIFLVFAQEVLIARDDILWRGQSVCWRRVAVD